LDFIIMRRELVMNAEDSEGIVNKPRILKEPKLIRSISDLSLKKIQIPKKTFQTAMSLKSSLVEAKGESLLASKAQISESGPSQINSMHKRPSFRGLWSCFKLCPGPSLTSRPSLVAEANLSSFQEVEGMAVEENPPVEISASWRKFKPTNSINPKERQKLKLPSQIRNTFIQGDKKRLYPPLQLHNQQSSPEHFEELFDGLSPSSNLFSPEGKTANKMKPTGENLLQFYSCPPEPEQEEEPLNLMDHMLAQPAGPSPEGKDSCSIFASSRSQNPDDQVDLQEIERNLNSAIENKGKNKGLSLKIAPLKAFPITESKRQEQGTPHFTERVQEVEQRLDAMKANRTELQRCALGMIPPNPEAISQPKIGVPKQEAGIESMKNLADGSQSIKSKSILRGLLNSSRKSNNSKRVSFGKVLTKAPSPVGFFK
jgi:hypothetical protein